MKCTGSASVLHHSRSHYAMAMLFKCDLVARRGLTWLCKVDMVMGAGPGGDQPNHASLPAIFHAKMHGSQDLTQC